jgi:hypothetical protein
MIRLNEGRSARVCAAWLAGLMVLAIAAHGQVPVKFLPGLNEDTTVWTAAGGSLAVTFNIAPSYASLVTSNSFQSQSSSLGSLSSSTVLVGHSAGGIVARLHGQSQALAGIVTLGTPNFGAPLEETFPVFCEYLGGSAFDGLELLSSLIPGIDQ